MISGAYASEATQSDRRNRVWGPCCRAAIRLRYNVTPCDAVLGDPRDLSLAAGMTLVVMAATGGLVMTSGKNGGSSGGGGSGGGGGGGGVGRIRVHGRTTTGTIDPSAIVSPAAVP
jgi:hypothetical protein